MSLTLSKTIAVTKISTVYGVSLGEDTAAAVLVYNVKSVSITDNMITAVVGLSLNGVNTPTDTSYTLPYNANGGDVTKQVEAYLLTQDAFAGAVQS